MGGKDVALPVLSRTTHADDILGGEAPDMTPNDIRVKVKTLADAYEARDVLLFCHASVPLDRTRFLYEKPVVRLLGQCFL